MNLLSIASSRNGDSSTPSNKMGGGDGTTTKSTSCKSPFGGSFLSGSIIAQDHEIPVSVYFYLTRKSYIEDDRRNQISLERKKVLLHPEDNQKLESGIIVAKMMLMIKKKIVRKALSIKNNFSCKKTQPFNKC